MSAAHLAGELLAGGRHLLLPGLCAGCRRPLLRQESVLCLHCFDAIPQAGFEDDSANLSIERLAGRVPFVTAAAFAFFYGDGIMQHLLHLLKYNRRADIGIYLGMQAGHAFSNMTWAKAIDAIIPVPLHLRKEADRGYNQSALIAEGLGRVLDKPVLSGALLRGKHTASQTKMTRGERVVNVQDAFYTAPKAALDAKHLLLVDDVLTTGATLEAAARAVLRVPDVRVSFFTAAIAM